MTQRSGLLIGLMMTVIAVLLFAVGEYAVAQEGEGEIEPCYPDTEPPVISQCAVNQTVVADVDGNAWVPEFTDVVATDNCTRAGALTLTLS